MGEKLAAEGVGRRPGGVGRPAIPPEEICVDGAAAMVDDSRLWRMEAHMESILLCMKSSNRSPLSRTFVCTQNASTTPYQRERGLVQYSDASWLWYNACY